MMGDQYLHDTVMTAVKQLLKTKRPLHNEHKDAYQVILDGVKGGTKEKRLAAQFIPKFFKHFPELADSAINAQLDLCEDEDVSIRRQAIKELPQFATGENLPRVADILTQLLQTDDSAEFNLVNNALLSIFKMDAKGTLGGLFSQILQGEDIVRERAIKFLSTKLKTLPDEVLTKEVEELILTESKKVLEDVTGEEFVLFMKILSGLKSLQTVSGRQQLVELVAEQADLEQTFNPSDPDCVDRLLQCTRQAVPLFSKNVHSTRFVTYFCEQVLPNLSSLTTPVEGLDIQLEVLKLLAEMSSFCGDMEKLETNLRKLFDKLLEYMPLPPEEAENGENAGNEEPKLQFSYVECLLYSFHQLGRKLPDFLTAKLNAEKLKDFKIRLQYFARGLQVYIRQLRLALQGKTGEALKTDENKIKVVALKITNNINVLIKDLFHIPPSYKSTVTLSWKPVQKVEIGQKRATEDTTSGSPPKKSPAGPKRDARQIYNPPSGKYSSNLGNFNYGEVIEMEDVKVSSGKEDVMHCGLPAAQSAVLLSVSAVSARKVSHQSILSQGYQMRSEVDSPMNLKHPHDLVILMRQETTVNYLKELEKQLVAQKIHIEENEDRDTGLEQRHNKEDPDCIKAKVPLGDLDLYDGTYITLESKDISPEDYIDTESPVPPDPEQPDCTKILELPYSIHAFQHLRGVQERVNLSAPLLPKEDPIFTYLSKRLGRNIDDIGHLIHEGLQKNSSSWVLYNMASFYWRIKNEPYQVVECAMRALHFSSRHNKDIALVNLANVLHRAHFSADAAVVVHAALDDSDFFTSYYTLGNIYAMLGEYNHSVLCYDHALQAKPGFEQALKRKHAVLCQQKLEQKLEAQHRSLQRTLNELKEYQKQHDHYLRQQEILEKHKLIQEEQILRNIIHETQMAKEAQLGNHQICRLVNQQHSLHCQWDQPVRYHRGDIFENVDYVQFGEDSSTSSMMSVNFDVQTNQSDVSNLVKSPPVAHSVLWIWGRDSDAYRDKQNILWPKRADCAESYPRVPVGGELPTYFLPPENKGLRQIHELNSDDYSSEEEAQTPDCSITDFRKSQTLSYLVKELEVRMDLKAKMPDDHARKILLSRINNYTIPEEEIGSFLFHAINKPNAPVWLILNEAGLYWRAVGNSTFAIACLQRALNLAPLQYQDIPLVNLANLLIHYGLHLDAAKLLLQALAINSSEPLTFLSLGNAYLALKNISGALEAFRQALKLTTKCPECESSLKLIRCMQFYPFLYNITSSVCSGNCHEKTPDNNHDKQKYFDNAQSLDAAEEEPSETGTEEAPVLSVESSGRDSDVLRLESTVVEESNGSDEIENADETKMSEEILALVDEFQQAWPLDGFGGALEMKGRRLDLQGIRVLKKGPQDGVAKSSCYGDCRSEDDEATEWITFQVKRVKKPKGDHKKNPGKKIESNQAENAHRSQANLEITGPKVASPGPQGKKRDYQSLGWPSPDECVKLRWVELTAIVSTWLAVSSKNIDITEHIDFATPIQQPAMEPLCNGNLPTSMHTLDHLHGVSNRASLHYTGESQLTEVLQNLGKDQYPQQSLEQIGTRIAKVLEKNQTSWVLSSMAALYWRVKGQGKKAIDCLRQALHYAPHQMKDVPLISLANILHNAKLWNDAVIVATMAVEIAPHFAVNHFTLGNVYVAMEEFEKALVWYESTLKLQPEFVPAKNRIQTIQCHLMLKKGRRSP
ncbi:Tetratricopeptide repeat protein 17 [Myotis brandtii]|uniref:Apoptosis inhibitor 5 n=5 Tax=Boreoeutheria TaxID=1437010 RepID=S7N1A9_MYOBR|nr:Tetratricopeptide repeat protein 17 [Myotis brandtii]